MCLVSIISLKLVLCGDCRAIGWWFEGNGLWSLTRVCWCCWVHLSSSSTCISFLQILEDSSPFVLGSVRYLILPIHILPHKLPIQVMWYFLFLFFTRFWNQKWEPLVQYQSHYDSSIQYSIRPPIPIFLSAMSEWDVIGQFNFLWWSLFSKLNLNYYLIGLWLVRKRSYERSKPVPVSLLFRLSWENILLDLEFLTLGRLQIKMPWSQTTEVYLIWYVFLSSC